MTELERYEPARSPIDVWTEDFTKLAMTAGQLARTNFIPASLRVFRNNGKDYDPEATAAQVAAAILTGRELGLETMASLRSIDVIQNVPSLRAIALRGILQAHGHEIWVEEATNNRCTVAGRRAGSENVQRITWTMDDAKSRGLAGKNNWRSQPRNMLLSRATSDVARLIAADALLGVGGLSSEELEDGDTVVLPPGTAPVPTAGPRKARRAVAPSGVTRPDPAPLTIVGDEPSLDDDASIAVVKPDTAAQEPDEPPLDDTVPEPELEPATITPPQMRMMQALFSEQNFGDRQNRLDFTRQTIEREIESSSELTVDEASKLINALRALPPTT